MHRTLFTFIFYMFCVFYVLCGLQTKQHTIDALTYETVDFHGFPPADLILKMVVILLFKTDEDKPPAAICQAGKHIFGRNELLGYKSTSVSRKHASLNVEEKTATLKALGGTVHYMHVGARKISCLEPNEEIIVKDGDRFSLNIKEFWYKVKYSEEVKEENNEISEVTDSLKDKNNAPSASQATSGDMFASDVVNAATMGSKRSCAVNDDYGIMTKRLCLDKPHYKVVCDATLPDLSNGVDIAFSPILFTSDDEIVNMRTSIVENAAPHDVVENADPNNANENGKPIEIAENDVPCNVDENAANGHAVAETCGVDEDDENVQIQSTANVEENVGNSVQNIDPNALKTEVVEVEADKGTSNNRRDPCWYGASCYRKKPAHRQQFSHPGDSDYITSGSDPNDTRDECPYGAKCYRKNPQHRAQYKHPSGPAPKLNDRRRARRAARRNDTLNDSPIDDYDLEDPFIDDGSSDEYSAESDYSESDSDTDFTPSQEDSEDVKRLVKEAKKFTKH